MGSVLAIRHVPFEDLGSFEPLLRNADFSIDYVDAPTADIAEIDALTPDVLVVLGGPIGAYEESAYPFLRLERELLERRLSAHRPTLGICLGSQLLARALGAEVYSGHRKEIGWAPLLLTDAGRDSSLMHLGGDVTPVLHWHSDTFDLPQGATLLASTRTYEQQAFLWGGCALGLQFHPEVTARQLETWYVGNAIELAQAGIVIENLRTESRWYAPVLQACAEVFLYRWLAESGI